MCAQPPFDLDCALADLRPFEELVAHVALRQMARLLSGIVGELT